VIRHLTSLGHRRIAFICGPAKNGDAVQRLRGYRTAMRAAGIGDAFEIPGNFSEESGYDAARKIAEDALRPTAVFAANDAMAIGALSAFNEIGIRVPDEIALVGFDDIPIARFLSPPLTTVRVPIAELGRRSLEALLDSSRRKVSQTLETLLVVRQSCGATRTKSEEDSR
jgi:LacI family transcriptional regulator